MTTPIPPQHIRMTSFARTMFGFDSYVRVYPTLFSAQYLQNLISQEGGLSKSHRKISATLLFLVSLAVIYVQGIKLNYKLFGHDFPDFPAGPEVLCFILGVNLFAFAACSLDMMVIASMRVAIVQQLVTTDMPNIMTAHVRGHNLWPDVIAARFIGYSSGRAHRVFPGAVGIVFMLIFAAILTASAATLYNLHQFGLQRHAAGFDWRELISTMGLVMGALGVIVPIFALAVPFRFSMAPPPGPPPQAGALPGTLPVNPTQGPTGTPASQGEP